MAAKGESTLDETKPTKNRLVWEELLEDLAVDKVMRRKSSLGETKSTEIQGFLGATEELALDKVMRRKSSLADTKSTEIQEFLGASEELTVAFDKLVLRVSYLGEMESSEFQEYLGAYLKLLRAVHKILFRLVASSVKKSIDFEEVSEEVSGAWNKLDVVFDKLSRRREPCFGKRKLTELQEFLGAWEELAVVIDKLEPVTEQNEELRRHIIDLSGKKRYIKNRAAKGKLLVAYDQDGELLKFSTNKEKIIDWYESSDDNEVADDQDDEILKFSIKKEKIIDWLRDESFDDNEVRVTCIVSDGGGIGKTSYMRLLYEDYRVTFHFDLKGWAHVSEEFDVLGITKAVLESITWEICDSNDLDLLQARLKEELSGKKFLLVLDDFSNNNYDDWIALCSPFMDWDGPPGSKIVVTTRSGEVASMVDPDEVHYMEALSLSALDDLGYQNFDAHPNLKVMGNEIAQYDDAGGIHFTSEEFLEIDGCSFLASFVRSESATGFKHMKIRHCTSIVSLLEWMTKKRNTSLEYLEFNECSFPAPLPRSELPSTLKQLKITNCTHLESLLEVLMDKENTSLESLEIDGCSSLVSFPSGKLPTTLKQLQITNCVKLEFLPEGLHNLTYLDKLSISNCPSLMAFPEGGLPTTNLTSLMIYECEDLRSLPNQMHKLTSLQNLSVRSCSSLMSFPEGGLPCNLVSLIITDCENLRPLSEWELHKLMHLEKYTIIGECPYVGVQ